MMSQETDFLRPLTKAPLQKMLEAEISAAAQKTTQLRAAEYRCGY
jgi:hypothetical protein